MVLTAQRFVRKMRGGAQAHLLQAADNGYYVVKFAQNPQHRRILINEWVAGVFLRYLQLTTPQTDFISLSPEFLAASPEVYLQCGAERRLVLPGWHFGSRFPGDPATLAVYDYLPDALLSKVENRHEFIGMLAIDKWLGNTDSRQSIFFRARLKDWLSTREHPLRTGFVSLMMDNGYMFNGPHWDFPDAPMHGLYFRPMVYSDAASIDTFEPWLERIRHIPENVFDEALRQVPAEWLEQDGPALEALLETLYRRRTTVAQRIMECRQSRPNLFPAWH